MVCIKRFTISQILSRLLSLAMSLIIMVARTLIFLSRCGLMVCMILLFFGQSLFGLSAVKVGSLFWLACIARFFVGLGSKNVSVARTTYCSDWFIGQELAFALGLGVGVSRLGVIVAMFAFPIIYNWTKSFAFNCWFTDVFVLFSTVCGLIAILLDQYAINESGYKRKTKKSDGIKFSDLKNLGLKYWLLPIIVGMWHMSFNCFINISNKVAQERFHLTIISAGYLAVSFVC